LPWAADPFTHGVDGCDGGHQATTEKYVASLRQGNHIVVETTSVSAAPIDGGSDQSIANTIRSGALMQDMEDTHLESLPPSTLDRRQRPRRRLPPCGPGHRTGSYFADSPMIIHQRPSRTAPVKTPSPYRLRYTTRSSTDPVYTAWSPVPYRTCAPTNHTA